MQPFNPIGEVSLLNTLSNSELEKALTFQPTNREILRALGRCVCVGQTADMEMFLPELRVVVDLGRVIVCDPIEQSVVDKLKVTNPLERLSDGHFHWPFQAFVLVQPRLGDDTSIVFVRPGVDNCAYLTRSLAVLRQFNALFATPTVCVNLDGTSEVLGADQYDDWVPDAMATVEAVLTLMHVGGIKWEDYGEKIRQRQRTRAAYTALKTGPYTTTIDPNRRRTGEAQGGTHASPIVHLRRGHPRNLPDERRIWIKDCIVGAGGEEALAFADRYRTHYEIKTPNDALKSKTPS